MKIDDLEDIKNLIIQNENEQIEFKETTGQLERGMETLCAFLNGAGGTVLFGVTDKEDNRTGSERQDKTGYYRSNQADRAIDCDRNFLHCHSRHKQVCDCHLC